MEKALRAKCKVNAKMRWERALKRIKIFDFTAQVITPPVRSCLLPDLFPRPLSPCDPGTFLTLEERAPSLALEWIEPFTCLTSHELVLRQPVLL